MRRALLFLACCLVLTVASPAFGGSIGPICGSCQGSIYTLTYSTIGTNLFQITYTINTAGYNGGGALLDDVSFKVSSADPTNVSLVSAPNGVSDWTVLPGGISAAGCDTHGSGFVCAEAKSSLDSPGVPSGTYTWVFDLSTTGLFTGVDQASIKARYGDVNGRKVGALLSEDITLTPNSTTPEPASLFLLGSGLIGAFGVFKRRLRK